MSDLSKTFPELVAAMIVAKNPGKTLTPADFVLNEVGPSTHSVGRNSEVVITGTGPRYGGFQTFYYNRLDLSDIVGEAQLIFEYSGQTRLSEVVAEFNTRFKTNLKAGEDYTDEDLPAFTGTAGESHDVALLVLGVSYFYIGQLTLTVAVAPEGMAETFSSNELDGLTYEPPGGQGI